MNKEIITRDPEAWRWSLVEICGEECDTCKFRYTCYTTSEPIELEYEEWKKWKGIKDGAVDFSQVGN